LLACSQRHTQFYEETFSASNDFSRGADFNHGLLNHWQYTFSEPAKEWLNPGNPKPASSAGRLPFGQIGTDTFRYGSNIAIGTPWNTETLWLAGDFNLSDARMTKLILHVTAQASIEVWLNGPTIAQSALEQFGEVEFTLPPEAVKSLRRGRNRLAIKAVRQVEPSRGQLLNLRLEGVGELTVPAPAAGDIQGAAWTAVASAIFNLHEALIKP
jgi:hypothetical protein